ncbi:hypothetical protein CCS01_15090 [Rhodopila globiformis]|uniref:Uncharacterized protein n=1 Tax=Rhodopila globiformis TaxID=1071 RepID=A0A2S6NEF7_RHOGL|nr:hypothetical protein CCS01_15090 [Rhodopila globiformis]
MAGHPRFDRQRQVAAACLAQARRGTWRIRSAAIRDRSATVASFGGYTGPEMIDQSIEFLRNFAYQRLCPA